MPKRYQLKCFFLLKQFHLPLFIFLMCSCKKTVPVNPVDNNVYRVEYFRKPGMDDYQTIMAACDSVPNYSTLLFANKSYILAHSLIIYKSINFKGPCIIKRENQNRYMLTEAANSVSTVLILNNTLGLSEGDGIFVTFGQEDAQNTAVNTIKSIRGDSIFLSAPLGTTGSGTGYFVPGTSVFKNIILFWIVGSDSYPYIGSSFDNITFDGNRDNNRGSFSWRINTAILAITKNTTVYKNCLFTNSPGETIIGHNADIRNCIFYNLNGSAFHTSADKVTWEESEIHSYLSDNLIENTNQVSNSIGGHSEGSITHSNSGGYYTATRNIFINVGASVLGTLYPSVSVHDWGTSNITFTGNTINGAGRIVSSIAFIPGTIHDVRIEKNIISNMPSFDWTAELNYWPGIILKDKSGE